MSSPRRPLYVGLISGTSMDGIDAALLQIEQHRCQLLATSATGYASELRSALIEASRNPGACGVDDIGHLDHWVAGSFRDAALSLLDDNGLDAADILAIGSHGQTLRHLPQGQRPFTLQLGDPNIIAAGTGITTVADFRRRDMAEGGEGAPLAPAFHEWLCSEPLKERVVLNIGGFANITVLPGKGAATGFDTGPGNSLMDGWCATHRQAPFDVDGAWAASGNPIGPLLEQMLDDRYFAEAPPKSTGFEYFNRAWLQDRLDGFDGAAPADVQATLCELTARTIADAINRYAPGTGEVYLCGGGTHNRQLVSRLVDSLPDCAIRDTRVFGIEPDWIEAAAFAWLASRTLAGKPGNLPAVTGARRQAILGGIFPGRG